MSCSSSNGSSKRFTKYNTEPPFIALYYAPKYPDFLVVFKVFLRNTSDLSWGAFKVLAASPFIFSPVLVPAV